MDGILSDMRDNYAKLLRCVISDPSGAAAAASLFAAESANPSSRSALIALGGLRLINSFAESSDSHVQLLAAYSLAHLSAEKCNVQAIIESNCLTLLNHMLERGNEDVLLQSAAIAFSNIASSSEAGKKAVIAAGAAKHLKNLAVHGSPQVRAEAADALVLLTCGPSSTIFDNGLLRDSVYSERPCVSIGEDQLEAVIKLATPVIPKRLTPSVRVIGSPIGLHPPMPSRLEKQPIITKQDGVECIQLFLRMSSDSFRGLSLGDLYHPWLSEYLAILFTVTAN